MSNSGKRLSGVLGIRVPKLGVESNSDMFAKRGDDWSAPIRDKTPRFSPDGELRVNRDAHLYLVKNPNPPKNKSPYIENPDLDQYFCDRSEPISLRLARERNKVIPSMSSSASPSASGSRMVLNLRAKLRNKRNSLLVKVK